MKKIFIFVFILLLSKPTAAQWVLDYQFANSTTGVTSISAIDSNYVWFVAIDSINNRQIYKKENQALSTVNSSGIYRPNKLVAVNKDTAYMNAIYGGLYRTNNSGNNWLIIRDSVLYGYTYSIDVRYPDHVVAGQFENDSSISVLFTSSNGGMNWLRQDIPFTTEYTIFDVRINDPAHIYAGMNCPDINCGSLRYWYTSNGGDNWLIKDIPLVSNNMWILAPVFNINNTTGFLFAPGFNVYRFKSINAGINWSSPEYFSSGNTEGFVGIKNIDSTQTWFSASGLKIYKTTNDGVNWNEMNIPIVAGENIFTFDFIRVGNKYYGYFGTDKGKIYRLVESIFPIGITPISTEIPKSYSLSQNYPNPFNPVTKIRFSLPHSGYVKLSIYDALGKEVSLLVNENLQAGVYETDFDASNIPSGVYFYRLEAVDPLTALRVTETKKMVLIK